MANSLGIKDDSLFLDLYTDLKYEPLSIQNLNIFVLYRLLCANGASVCVSLR